MEPPTPLTYKRRSKIRSKTRERFSGLSAQQKNAAIQKIQQRLGQTDNPKAPALQAKLGAARNPLIAQAAKKAGFERPDIEGFKGAQGIGRLSEKIGKLGTPPATDTDGAAKLAALQAKLAEQKGFRKQIGTARRTALGPDFDRTKLAYGKKKKKTTATASNQSATPL
jgi:hypothetical protein